MSDIKLFRLSGPGGVKELHGTTSSLEKPLQNLIEANLTALLGIRFLATEHTTGKRQAGRIDTLGLDENNSPVIIEYKRSSNENIINQGLFYLDWLMDHQAEFKLMVLEKFGKPAADAIDWSGPRLICIAADFTKYDSYAVQQMDRNIELIRYRQFGSELLLLELVNAVATSQVSPAKAKTPKEPKVAPTGKTIVDSIEELSASNREIFDELDDYVTSLGDDVQRKNMKLYVAYKRLRNFATLVITKKYFLLFLHLDPTKVAFDSKSMRDVREVGHWGTGDLEITLTSLADLEKVKPLIVQAYEGGPDVS